MEGLDELRQEIEVKRVELGKLTQLLGLRGKLVLEKSQELDRLLNFYNELLNGAEGRRDRIG